jgi:cytochrome c-type biogenesis protein CcmH
MSAAFVAIAALLALAAVACVALPLVLRRRRPDAGNAAAAGSLELPASPVAATVAAFLVLGGAAGLYATWSTWTWPAAAPEGAAATPADMVSKLARRLEEQPEDVDGWLMLGRSYAALGQFPLAVRAYQRADRLENGRNVEALTGWAEALALGNEAELEGRAGQLFERALALEPTSPKALFFSAVAAQRRGELPLALQRFETMLAGGPPDNVRPLLEQQVATLKAAIAGMPAGADGAQRAPGGATAPAAVASEGSGAAPAAAGASRAAATGTPVIRVQVRLAPSVAARVAAGAPLFVFVRVPGQPGPPLAVKRLAATLPQRVELTPADAMMGGRGFAAGDRVEVTARVALGGQPTASPGDPFGQVGYDVGRDGEKDLVIDRLTP